MIWWTSSTTPGMVWCSCTTPSMRKPQTAEPRSDESSMRRIALPERVAEAPLERLQAEFGHVGIVLALRRFDELRADESAKIDRVCHVS